MNRISLVFGMLLFFFTANAQLVEVRADYNSVGDVEFVAYNNTKAPLFLNLNFANLENTTFNEPLPFIKQLEPGFNSLFMLERDLNSSEVPRFHYEIKYFRSNPMGKIDLDFPYLVPFEAGKKVESFNVKSISGFMGINEPESWSATGFKVNAGDKIYAARTGIIVEITGARRDENSKNHYNGWNNSITVLQADGTLACYKNVVDSEKKWKVGEKVFAGQHFGNTVAGLTEMLLLVYHESVLNDELVFIIPEFVIDENKSGFLISEQEITIIHPDEIRSREMDKKEIRKWLK